MHYDAIEDSWVLSQKQEEFMDWLLLTPKLRAAAELPSSQKQMAAHLGVGEQTLIKWKKDNRFNEALVKRQRELNLSPDKVQVLLEQLYEQALDGDTKSANLWLQVVGKHQPEVKVVTERQDIADLSDAELEALVAKQLEELRSRKG